MALETGSRINPTLNPMPAEIIAAVRQRPFRGILVFIARLDFGLAGMTIGAERLLMAGRAGKFLLGAVKFMLEVKIRGPVIQGTPLIGMTTHAVGESLDLHRMFLGHTDGLGTGIENTPQDQQYQDQ
jgi:hypothetical protein